MLRISPKNMDNSGLRFTAQEKLAILNEIQTNGLEATLRKHSLTIETLSRWRKQFKKSNAKSKDQVIETLKNEIERLNAVIAGKDQAKNTKSDITVAPPRNDKEDAFLRLVASLIAEVVMKKNMSEL